MSYRAVWIGVVAGLMGLLVLPGPSEAQETITVTTLVDTADPPFDAADSCGVGTMGDLPGADGEVSLREAIIAANNTEGGKTIVFNPGLIGKPPLVVGFDTRDADLALNPLPWLCGGFVTIVGDINGDGESDITLEGSALEEGEGFLITSSGNTLIGLTLINFPGTGVVLLPLSETTLTSNTLMGNVISGSGGSGIRIQAGLSGEGGPPETSGIQTQAGLSDAGPPARSPSLGSITQTTIQENNLQFNGLDGMSVLVLAPLGESDASVSDTTITGNTIEENGSNGVTVQVLQVEFSGGGPPQGNSLTQGVNAAARAPTIANTTITDNLIMGNGDTGVAAFPFKAQGAVITRTTISSNTISANKFTGVAIRGGIGEAADNRVDAVIEGNTVTNNGVVGERRAVGIQVIGGLTSAQGEGATNSAMTVEIRNNLVQDNIGGSIRVLGGQGNASNNTIAGVIEGNSVANNLTEAEGPIGGISLVGGAATDEEQRATRNTVRMDIIDNLVQGNAKAGLAVVGGRDGGEDNTVAVTLAGNTIADHDRLGMFLAGGWNTNEVPAIASRNTLRAQISANQVSGSGVFGIAVFGGFEGLAEGNTVRGTLSNNTVADSGDAGIAFFGGFDNVLGVIEGNVVQGAIVNNTADGIECASGIAGNRARCVRFDNTITP